MTSVLVRIAGKEFAVGPNAVGPITPEQLLAAIDKYGSHPARKENPVDAWHQAWADVMPLEFWVAHFEAGASGDGTLPKKMAFVVRAETEAQQ